MSIPQPSKGQPIDSSYITKIVTTINDIVTKISSKFSNSNIYSSTLGTKAAIRTTDLVFVGGYEKVSNATGSTTNEVSQIHQFGVTFAYPPVVTATPVIINTSFSGKTVSVYVKDVTTSSATVVVKFSTVDTPEVGINLIAVGLPSV